MEAEMNRGATVSRVGPLIVVALAALAVVTAVRHVWPSHPSTAVYPVSEPVESDVRLTPGGAYTDRNTGLRFVLGPATTQSITEDGVCDALGHPQDAFMARVTITNTGKQARTVPTNWLELWQGGQYITFGNADLSAQAPPLVRIRPRTTRSIRVHYDSGIGYDSKSVTIRWDDQSRVSPYPPPIVGTYTVAPTGFNPCSLP
jgi:hypothetical protein